MVAAFERDTAARLAEIGAATEQAARPLPFSADETLALRRAVQAVAAELITAPP